MVRTLLLYIDYYILQPDYQMTLGLTPVLGDHSDAATRGLVRYDLEWSTIFSFVFIIGPPCEVEIEGLGDETRGWGDPIPKLFSKKVPQLIFISTISSSPPS